MLESDMEEDVGNADAAERGVHPPPAPAEQDHRRHHGRTASMELEDPGGAQPGPESINSHGRAIAFCRKYCGTIRSVVSTVFPVTQLY